MTMLDKLDKGTVICTHLSRNVESPEVVVFIEPAVFAVEPLFIETLEFPEEVVFKEDVVFI